MIIKIGYITLMERKKDFKLSPEKMNNYPIFHKIMNMNMYLYVAAKKKRITVNHQKFFGKDLCTYARTRSKNVHARLSKLHINLCLLHACLVLLCAYLLNRSSDLYEILILRS